MLNAEFYWKLPGREGFNLQWKSRWYCYFPLPVSSRSWKGFFFFEQFQVTVKIAGILTNICTHCLSSSGIELQIELQIGCTGKFPYVPYFSRRYLCILHLRIIAESQIFNTNVLIYWNCWGEVLWFRSSISQFSVPTVTLQTIRCSFTTSSPSHCTRLEKENWRHKIKTTGWNKNNLLQTVIK